jgi:hypothetical protein
LTKTPFENLSVFCKATIFITTDILFAQSSLAIFSSITYTSFPFVYAIDAPILNTPGI